MYKKINKCRICGNKKLAVLVDLGMQALTGIFPKYEKEIIEKGPLRLVKCFGKSEVCGLVQLQHNFSLNVLYGGNYGYRSGLNSSMVKHLQSIVKKILKIIPLKTGDVIIDIGSNDGTLLQQYPKKKFILIGVDPTGEKFKKFYPGYIKLIPDFFPSEGLKKIVKERKAKVITSIAMFYDLEDPISFMHHIYDALDDNGIWVFEQSYMPSMLAVNAYDTICHEHLEYYALKQIKYMTDKVGLKIIDVEFNNTNGGSFCVTVSKKESLFKERTSLIQKILTNEEKKGLNTLLPYKKFNSNIKKHKNKLLKYIQRLKKQGKIVLGYGASTKGNVLLQFCQLTKEQIPFIAEINEDKFGKVTPGTNIPIISELEARSMNPDYFVVLPWHFKENIMKREKNYLQKGGHLFFPLPQPEII